jgi:hypothetical protein
LSNRTALNAHPVGAISGVTGGSIPFVDATTLALNEDSGLAWDNTNKRLGVGVVPSQTAHIKDAVGTTQVRIDALTGVANDSVLSFANNNTDYARMAWDNGDNNFYISQLYTAGGIVFKTNNIERAVISSDGTFKLRSSAIPAKLSVATNGNMNVIYADCFSATAVTTSSFTMRKSHSSTMDTLTETVAGDAFGEIAFSGVNASSAYKASSAIACYQEGAAGATYVGSYIAFYTGTNAATPAERIRITAAGSLGIGTNAPTSKLHVVGLVEYADNAAAVTGGLTVGAFYRTGDLLKVVHA